MIDGEWWEIVLRWYDEGYLDIDDVELFLNFRRNMKKVERVRKAIEELQVDVDDMVGDEEDAEMWEAYINVIAAAVKATGYADRIKDLEYKVGKIDTIELRLAKLEEDK